MRVQRQHAAGHDHNPDDSFGVERQPQCKVTLVCHFASFMPAGDLARTLVTAAELCADRERCLHSRGQDFNRVREYRPALLLWLRALVVHSDRGSEHAIRAENGSQLAF